MSREMLLREYLNDIRDRYDAILLDCCPCLGILAINTLAAADEVIIPAQAHYLSFRDMEQLIRTISNVKQGINSGREITDTLIIMADMRTNYSREIIDPLRSIYGSKLRIFDSIILLSIRAAETSAGGACMRSNARKIQLSSFMRFVCHILITLHPPPKTTKLFWCFSTILNRW